MFAVCHNHFHAAALLVLQRSNELLSELLEALPEYPLTPAAACEELPNDDVLYTVCMKIKKQQQSVKVGASVFDMCRGAVLPHPLLEARIILQCGREPAACVSMLPLLLTAAGMC